MGLLLASVCQADIGCRSGNYIYTVQTAATYNNGSDVLPVYSETSGVILRTYPADPNCGFLNTTAAAYPSPAGTPSNPNSKCSHSGSLGDISTLVIYDPADNTCNLPIDDYVFSLGAFFSIVIAFIVRLKYRLLISRVQSQMST